MRWISLFRQVPKVRPDGQVPKEIQESGGPRGKRESLALRVRKAFKGRPVHKGRWARPALGEKRENLVRRGFREKLVLRVRKASKERSAYKGRWARPAPGEKRENLALRAPKEPRVRQGQWEHKGRQDRRGLPGKHRKLRWKRTPP